MAKKLIGYAMRMIRDVGNQCEGEYWPAKAAPTSTPDLTKAKIYKDFKRAYGWGYSPQDNEIVEVFENNGTRSIGDIVESRKAAISQMGDIYFDHLGNPRA